MARTRRAFRLNTSPAMNRRGCRDLAAADVRDHLAPDAGKTTLTEKLLLFGGAIQMAAPSRGARPRATPPPQRGISVTSSVMQFPYGGCVVNLLDTPGHEDFSEDTYRTLTAVDSALMVIDCAKGVEERTISLLVAGCATRRS